MKTSAVLSLKDKNHRWLITGAAGFIGSNLLEELLSCDQKVVGIDNFETGFRENLEDVKLSVSGKQWKNFSFREGDIRDIDTCLQVCEGVDYVLHQAALGSVPRSIERPIQTNDVNVNGFLNILEASRQKNVRKIVFASSSSVYGDHEKLPKEEGSEGRLLSPYAVSKHVNEAYADVFSKTFGMAIIGLRYFNVFGPRQDPSGPYAAVIPKWVHLISGGDAVKIFGDGSSSRDFCYIDNVISANILAATNNDPEALNKVYNIAIGERTTLNELYHFISTVFFEETGLDAREPQYLEFRRGDVLHSHADITRAKKLLGYCPTVKASEGLKKYIRWTLSGKS